jgi:glycosyltransferase involved in cell wall biosynthesis
LLLLKPDITISLLRREINFLNSIQDGSRKMGEIHFDRENYRSLRGEKARNPIEVLMAKFWMAKLIKELKKLERFIVLTKEDQKKWTELSNTTVIYNPLPFKPEVVSDCSAKQVILVGRYTHQKGIDMMIQTWKFVAEKHPDWTLKVYGAGDRTSYQKLVDEAGIGGSVCLEGPTPDIEAKYLESSIFVLSSRHEGFGMVLIEAMACGLPVVSFTCPCGPRDIVTEGKDGFLVDLGDVKALAEKICVLIEDEALRKEMGVNARMNIDRFDLDKIAQQWENVFSYKK